MVWHLGLYYHDDLGRFKPLVYQTEDGRLKEGERVFYNPKKWRLVWELPCVHEMQARRIKGYLHRVANYNYYINLTWYPSISKYLLKMFSGDAQVQIPVSSYKHEPPQKTASPSPAKGQALTTNHQDF